MNRLSITWMGNASIKIETESTNTLIDPFVEFDGGENPNRAEDYLGADVIVITHGHFDHIGSLPEILSLEAVPVYCTQTSARSISDLTQNLPCHDAVVHHTHIVSPGDAFQVGDMEISLHPGKHIRFDFPLILKTFLS